MATNREMAVLPVVEERKALLGANFIPKNLLFAVDCTNDDEQNRISSAHP